MQYNFDRACEFMSAYVSSKHAEAQPVHDNRQAADGQRRNISATGSDVDRGGRGQGGRSCQQSDRTTGCGRSGRGRINGRTRAYNNNVDDTDPHRNFTAAEWKRQLSTMQSIVLQMRNDNQLLTNSTAQHTASVVSVNGSTANKNATTNDNLSFPRYCVACRTVVASVAVPMATTDTSEPAVRG
jgi:hypothetical protein